MSINNGENGEIKPGEQDNYEVAIRDASKKLSESDIELISKNSDTEIIKRNGTVDIIVPFLLEKLVLSYPEITFKYQDKEDEVPDWLKILTLHYLVNAMGTPFTGKEITYKQLEGGLSYYPVFQKRTTGIIFKIFGKNFKDFIDSGMEIGGIVVPQGDYSLKFKPFPRVEVTFIIWKGDDEFPSEGSVVFDSSISDYFSAEDVTMLCNMISVIVMKESFKKKK